MSTYGNENKILAAKKQSEVSLLIEKFASSTDGYDLITSAVQSLASLGASDSNSVSEIFSTADARPIISTTSAVTGSILVTETSFENGETFATQAVFAATGGTTTTGGGGGGY